MWNIWKEEVYKLASRKILWLGFFLLAFFAGLRLMSERRNYTVTAGEQTYYGKEAIALDKRTASEYAGILTEEKIQKIYDTFGFYYYDAEKEIYIGNFCSRFMTSKMTNFNQTSGESLDEIHFLTGEEWKNNAEPLLDGSVWFDYTYGWEDLKEIFSILIVIALLILFIIGVSPVFSEEYTFKTADILLTSWREKRSCIWLKMSAALFLSVMIYTAFAVYLLLLYLSVYGTQGLDASAVLINVPRSGFHPEKISSFFLYSFLLGLSAILLLVCITMAVSAYCKNAFLTVILSLGLFFVPYVWMSILSGMLLPLLGTEITKALSHFMISMPFYLSVHWGFAFSRNDTVLHLLTAAAVGGDVCGVQVSKVSELSGIAEAGGRIYMTPDAGKRNFFLFLFRLRTVRNSKFSASRLWQRTDRCLMPWRYGMLYAVALAGTFWGFQVLTSGRQ